MNIPSKVSDLLHKNETIVFKPLSVSLSMPNQSIVGTHSLYISKQGRIFAHDTGGIFGDETAKVSNSRIVLKLTNAMAHFSAETERPFGFGFYMNAGEYVNRINEIPAHLLVPESEWDTLARYDYSHRLTRSEVLADRLVLTDKDNVSHPHVIPYRRISSLETDGIRVVLKGKLGEADEITLVIPDKAKIKLLQTNYRNRPTVYTVVGEGAEVYTVTVRGVLHGHAYPPSGQKLFLAVKKDRVLFVDEETLDIVAEYGLGQVRFFQDRERWFLLQEEELCAFQFDEWNLSEWRAKVEPEEVAAAKIGLTPKGNPFYLQHTVEGVKLLQAKGVVLAEFANTEILDLAVAENPGEEDVYTAVRAELTGEREAHLFLPHACVPPLIQNVYRFSKSSLLAPSTGQQLFFSWSRMMNDNLLYQYCLQLFMIREGMAEIQEQEADDDTRLVQTANLLYHGLQVQKKMLDTTAIYWPAMLEQESRRVTGGAGPSLPLASCKGLQREMMGISGGISRALADVERPLSYVAKAIFPELNVRKKASLTRYLFGFGAGVAGALINPLGGLIVAASIIGNTYITDQMLEEEDRARLRVYVTQAMDAFHHLMNVLMPYYVSELNHAAYRTFEEMSRVQGAALEAPLAKTALFERMAALYTYHQLPIDETTAVPRKQVVEAVHELTELSGGLVASFEQPLRIGE